MSSRRHGRAKWAQGPRRLLRAWGYTSGYSHSVPKINVYLPDRLAEAVRRYEIPVSAACQKALEQEVAARLPVLELTPRARDVLSEAANQANRVGQNFIGVEHIVLAVLDEGQSIPAQVIESMGLTERLRAQLHETISSPSPTSNRVVDESGHIIGYLIDDDGQARLVDVEGKALRKVTDETGTYRVDPLGNRAEPIASEVAPFLLSLDEDGGPVVIIDEHGRHTGKKSQRR